MQMAQFLESLESDLDRIAAVGDDNVSQAATRLSQALRASAGMRLLDALGVAAVEISAQLPAGHVEVRMSGQDPNFVYVEESSRRRRAARRRRRGVRPHHAPSSRGAEGERRGRCRP